MLTGIIGLLINNVFKERGARQERQEAREEARRAADQAAAAAQNAEQTVKNTQNISNGFAKRVDNKLDVTISALQDIDNRLSDHLAWHLNNEQETRNAAERQHRNEQGRREEQHAGGQEDQPVG
jgi:hypothetical protein